jgi:hypothetical protein
VPVWAGTRPYQQLPFQWSCHVEDSRGHLTHHEFLNTSGAPPMRPFAVSLLETLGRDGPILIYSHFERTVVRQLAELFPDLSDELLGLIPRLVDLLPLTRRGYRHPALNNGYSLKAVLSTIAPDLDYQNLPEVRNGSEAQLAYLEAVEPSTSSERRDTLREHLLRYCERDTLALVRLVQLFEKAG